MSRQDRIRFAPGSGVDEAMGLSPFTGVAPKLGYSICTFCAEEGKTGEALLTPDITKTVGICKPRKIIKPDMDLSKNPPLYRGDKLIHVVDHVTACPEHAGRAIPTTSNKMIGMKWPNLRG